MQDRTVFCAILSDLNSGTDRRGAHMINQFLIKDTQGRPAFYICEIMPGVLRIADGKDQPLFIKRDTLINAILKTSENNMFTDIDGENYFAGKGKGDYV